jgi:hypothetical protein
MYKKLCFLILSVLMLTLTSASYGEVVIGNFEQQMNGWTECTWGPPGHPTFSYGTSGITLDSYSLKAVQPTGWYWFLINTGVNADDFRANNVIAMDVTRLANEWTRGEPTANHYCNLDVRFQDNRNYNLVGVGNAGDWDSNDPDANDTITATWDYTRYKNQPDVLSPNSTSIQIVIATSTGGYTGEGIWYIDNIRLLTSRNEKPRNGSWGVGLNPTLKWDEGSPTDKFDVYVGTTFEDVDNANRVDQPGLLFYSENYDPNHFTISGTTNGTTYYWRIDDVVGGTPVKGEVWHFTTYLPGAKTTVIGDWEEQMDGWVATDPNDANMVLGYSTTGATLNNYSLSVDAPQDWYNAVRIPINETGFTDQFLANNRFSLDVTCDTSEFSGDIESIVINGDEIQGLQLAPSSDTIIRSDGDLVTKTFKWDYTAIDFSPLPAEPNELTLSICTTAASRGRYYFDNARLYNSKVASDPMPGDNAPDVSRKTHLVWTQGEGAATHDVYFGADYDQVNDANRADHSGLLFYDENRAFDANDIDITDLLGYLLSFNTTYYWRVDEIEVDGALWKGPVWTFTVGNYFAVDDFEDYNDLSPDRIFDTWSDGWQINDNGSQVGYGSAPFAEKNIVHSGFQSMPFFYDNTSGVAYSEAWRSFDAPLNDWTRENAQTLTLFFKGYPQAFVEDPANTYTMSAGGADIWDISDEFRYAYKVLSDDGSITARVIHVDNTNGWAKAGVMIRETLEPFSKHGFMCVTPEGRRAFQNRQIDASDTLSANSDTGAITLPLWVKLARKGNTITAYYKSENDTNWTQQPDDENTSEDMSPNPQTIVMGHDVYIGLAHTSHNSDAMGFSIFSDVETTGNVTGDDWEVKAIGTEMLENDPAPLYIAVEGGGIEKIVEHPDNPDAVLANDWQQWDIPLSVLSDAGVSLSSVEKMTIGIGDKAAPQEAEGKIYFDDIRLYRALP